MDKKNIFLVLLIIGTAFWGISFSVTKMAIGHASSSTFLFYRFSAATMVLSAIFWKRLKQITWSSVKIGATLAVSLCLGIWLQTMGIKYSSASQCSFVAGTTVVIIPLLKMIFYKTFAPAKIWVAAGVALLGLSIIAIRDNFSVGIGDIYTIAGAVAFAVYLIHVEQQSGTDHIACTIIPMFAACAVFMFAVALTDKNASWMPVNNDFWIGIVFCSLLSTAYMYTVSNLSQRYLSAERVSIIYLFEPVFGAIAACFILGEHPAWRLFLGGALIFAATLISELKFTRKVTLPEAVAA